MARLSLTEQDRLIRKQWPDMQAGILADGFARWRGRVTSFSQSYEIVITYVTQRQQQNFVWAYADFPVVEVVGPALTRRADSPEQPIPHVYEETSRRALCLFDPAERGWTPDRPIADTILPWSADWLRFYEAWHATGEWKGGGRDHAERPDHVPSGPIAWRAQLRVDAAMDSSTSHFAIRAAFPADETLLATSDEPAAFPAEAAWRLAS